MKYILTPILILVLLISCAKIKVAKKIDLVDEPLNWPMFGGNPARTSFYPGELSLPLELVWDFKANSAIEKYIFVVNGIVYLGSKDGRVYALDIESGDKLGNIKMDAASTLAVADSNLIIARRYGDDTLFKYDFIKSKFRWKIDAGDISSEPLVSSNSVIVTALYNHIDLYDINSGVKIWQTKIDDQIRSSPAMSENIIIFGADDGFIYAVEKIDGDILWKFETGASNVAVPAIMNGTVFVGSSNKKFYAFDLHDGTLKWTFAANGQILQSAAVEKDNVIFGSTDSHVYCLNPLTGELRWRFEAKSVISTSSLIWEKKVVFGSLDFHYYVLDIQTGAELWKYKTKGRIRTSPVIWGDYLIGASENNNVYAFKSTGEK